MTVSIQPDWRQFLADNIFLVATLAATMAVSPLIPGNRYALGGYLLLFLTIIALLSVRYAVLRSFRWFVTDNNISRQRGIFSRTTDYIELYRVVDYKESQTLLQRILRVKTVTIISTDKTDATMEIPGVPYRQDLVGYIRNLVEQNKKENHIYEITNR